MTIRSAGFVVGVLWLTLPGAWAEEQASPWQTIEILAFTDFDSLDVQLDGKMAPAFLVGLAPLRETIANKREQDRLRDQVLGKLKKNALFAQVITTRGEKLGLSIDAFMHQKNDFGQGWSPNLYPYCWSGWGAFNLNSYFLYTKAAAFQDNFGENKRWRERFAEVVGQVRGAHRAAAIIPDLGSDSFATREAAAQELRTIGAPALAALYSAAGSTDLEMRRRAEGIIRALTKSNEPQ